VVVVGGKVLPNYPSSVIIQRQLKYLYKSYINLVISSYIISIFNTRSPLAINNHKELWLK